MCCVHIKTLNKPHFGISPNQNINNRKFLKDAFTHLALSNQTKKSTNNYKSICPIVPTMHHVDVGQQPQIHIVQPTPTTNLTLNSYNKLPHHEQSFSNINIYNKKKYIHEKHESDLICFFR